MGYIFNLYDGNLNEKQSDQNNLILIAQTGFNDSTVESTLHTNEVSHGYMN